MKNADVINAYWQHYLNTLPGVKRQQQSFDAWHFMNTEAGANELAQLVVNGIKSATCSLHWIYEHHDEPLPFSGQLSVIVDWEWQPVCIIETTEVRIVPYNAVDAQFAYEEGEGDRSLAYWRHVHWRFFTEECESIGRKPAIDMPLVCERFRVVYSGNQRE